MDTGFEGTKLYSQVEIPSNPANNGPIAEECCVICLGDISEPCEAHPCSHSNFDYLCLITWFQERAACPLCKASITEVRFEFSEDRKEWKALAVPDKNPETEYHDARQEGRTAAWTNPEGWRRPRETRLEQSDPESRRPNARSSTRTNHRRQRLRDWGERQESSLEDALRRRRRVYRHHLYSLHVGSNRHQVVRYRELTPQLFASDPALVSRAKMWIRRELRVFEFLDPDSVEEAASGARRRRVSNAEFLLEYIVAILKTVDIQGSCGQAEDMIQEFLGRESTRLFLHELRSWLRSPYESLSGWDRAVQYDARGAAVRESPMEEENSGSECLYPDHYPRRGDPCDKELRRYPYRQSHAGRSRAKSETAKRHVSS